MTRVLLIGLAGGLGTLTRYFIGLWAGKALGATFPYGTLIVNVLGCFLIAAITHAALTTSWISPTLRLTLTTGFMGGLTTYSSFNLETTKFFRDGDYAVGFMNLGVTVALCFASGLLGLLAAKKLVGT